MSSYGPGAGNYLRHLLEQLHGIQKMQDSKEQAAAQQQMQAQAGPPASIAAPGPPMDQNNMAPEASLAAPWHPPVGNPEYDAIAERVGRPQGTSPVASVPPESLIAFKKRQGPEYSGDNVEESLSPLDLLSPAAGLGGPINIAERKAGQAALKHAKPILDLGRHELRALLREANEQTAARIGAEAIAKSAEAQGTASYARMYNLLRDALEAKAGKAAKAAAETGAGKGGVRDGQTQIMKLLEALTKEPK